MEILNKLCRACNTEQNNLVHIFKQQNEPTNLTTMLEYCTRITPTDELKYPPWICNNCVKQLEICYRFLRRFKIAQDEFDVASNHLNEMEEYDEEHRIRKSPGLKSTSQENNGLIVNVKSEEPAIELSVEYMESSDATTDTHTTKTTASNNTTELRRTASPAVTCSICHKVFFTTKALHLHLKLGHKQKTAVS